MRITYNLLQEYKNRHLPKANFEIKKRDSRVGGYAIYKEDGKNGGISHIVDCVTAGECLTAMEAMLAIKNNEIKLK